MKRIVRILALALMICLLAGCSGPKPVETVTKTSHYLVNADGSEELLSYAVITITTDRGAVTQISETYSPDGTLWFTLENGKFTYEDAFTDAIKQEYEKQTGAISLLGTGSEDLVYEAKKDDAGNITDEYLSTKSGKYPSMHVKYELD